MKIKEIAQDMLNLEEMKSFVYLKTEKAQNVIKQLDEQIANCEKELIGGYSKFVEETPLGVVKDGMFLITCPTHDDNPEQTIWLIMGNIAITVMGKRLEIVQTVDPKRSTLDDIQYRLHILSKKFYIAI